MPIDDRDYMRDRASARYSTWLDNRSSAYTSYSGVNPREKSHNSGMAEHTRTRYALWLLLAGLTALVMAIAWDEVRLAQRLATQPDTFVHPERPAPPAAGEPPTTVSTRGPGSRSGRLVVVSETGAPGSYVRIAAGGEFWDAYVRSGETADIALLPGRYTVDLLDRITGSPRIPTVAVQVESASTMVMVRNPTPR